MKSSTDLFVLIKSLNRREKAYFRKFANFHKSADKNNYLKLYEAIEKIDNIKNYDEINIKKQLNDKKLTSSFPVVKKYLYDTILRSLVWYNMSSSYKNEITESLLKIDILNKKTLYGLSAKIIRRAKNLSAYYGYTHKLFELLRLERKLFTFGYYKNEMYTGEINILKDMLDVLNELTNYVNLEIISNKIYALYSKSYLRNQTISEKTINDLFKISSRFSKVSSFYSRLKLYELNGILCELKNDTKNLYENRKKYMEIFEEKPFLIEENFAGYLQAMINLSTACNDLNIKDEFWAISSKLKKFEEKFTKELNYEYGIVFIMNNLNIVNFYLKNEKKYPEFKRSVLNTEKLTERMKGSYDKEYELIIMFNIAWNMYISGDIDKSIKWVNRIINDIKIPQSGKFLIHSRILLCVLLYENGEIQAAESLYSSILRVLKLKYKQFALELFFLNKLPKLINNPNKADTGKLLKELKLLQTYEHYRNFTEKGFDFNLWLEKLHYGKSMFELSK